MNKNNNDNIKKPTNSWDKMVHAPFKKVVVYDLFCMGLGVMMGIGLGVFILKEGFGY